jgi:hypothetical protein
MVKTSKKTFFVFRRSAKSQQRKCLSSYLRQFPAKKKRKRKMNLAASSTTLSNKINFCWSCSDEFFLSVENKKLYIRKNQNFCHLCGYINDDASGFVLSIFFGECHWGASGVWYYSLTHLFPWVRGMNVVLHTGLLTRTGFLSIHSNNITFFETQVES